VKITAVDSAAADRAPDKVLGLARPRFRRSTVDAQFFKRQVSAMCAMSAALYGVRSKRGPTQERGVTLRRRETWRNASVPTFDADIRLRVGRIISRAALAR